MTSARPNIQVSLFSHTNLSVLDRFETPDGQTFDIIKIDRPGSHYMVLEADVSSTTNSQRGTYTYVKTLVVVHVISLDKKDVLKIVFDSRINAE